MFAGVSSSSQATRPNTEMRRQDRRWVSLQCFDAVGWVAGRASGQ